jgi:hypothetical protein
LEDENIQDFMQSVINEYLPNELIAAAKLLQDYPQLLELVRTPLYLAAFISGFVLSDDPQNDNNQYFTKRLEHGLLGSDQGDQYRCPSPSTRLLEQSDLSKC